MSLLLCHHCYTWVEPYGEYCPVCHEYLDLAAPDPALPILQAAIGDIVCCLGEVRVRRKHLPGRGMLYATTNGLIFLPHRIEEVTRMAEEPSAGSSLLWTLATLAWGPLALVSSLTRVKRVRPKRVRVYRPWLLTEAQSELLPRLLMDDPGVFFLARGSIHIIKRRWKGWSIERRQAGRLWLRPESSPRHFQSRMAELTASEAWCDVLIDL
jgi:hypothetical protein